MQKLISANPAKNYRKIGSVNISTASEIKNKVKMANEAKEGWKELGTSERIKMIKPIFKDFEKRKDELALLITREIGTPIKECKEEIDWNWDYLKWFFENGKKVLEDEITYKDEKSLHKIVYEPIGTTAVILPWNFPFDMFIWGVIPHLIAGNTVVMKHSEECPLTGRLIEKIMNKNKLPKGVFSETYGNGKVGEYLVKQDIDLIWFTGSSEAGKKLFEIAGKKFRKAILEMGGSNPAIIFEDVNINDNLINRLYFKRFLNCGQVCDAVKRLIIHKSKFDEVTEKLKNLIETKIVGDPEDEKTNLGPLVAKRQLHLLKDQVQDAIQKGAKVVIGGKSPRNLRGAFYLPTLLTDIKRDMRVWKEEVFGPVLPIVPFKTEEEAIALANDTQYGLGAAVFSKDTGRALRVASKLQAGDIDINKGNHWQPYNPFGGYKESGMGREHGTHGFRELCQIKVISTGK